MAIQILSSVKQMNETRKAKVRAYFNMEKWQLVDALVDAGIWLDVDVTQDLIYAFYEVEVDAWVNLDTGEVTLDGCQ